MFSREDKLSEMFSVISVLSTVIFLICGTLALCAYLCFNPPNNRELLQITLGSAIVSIVCILLSMFFEKDEDKSI